MSNNLMINVSDAFSMDVFAEQLANTYRAKGFDVTVANMNGNCIITFDKGTGGVNLLLGLGLGIKANCMCTNNVLSISFSDAEWTGKIVGLAVGWFLCFVPFITALIGCVNQSSLPKNICSDATMIASGM